MSTPTLTTIPATPSEVDLDCSAHIPVDVLLHNDSLPVRRDSGGVLVITAHPAPAQTSLADWFPGQTVQFAPVDRAAVQDMILASRSDDVADAMANGFARRWPELAARTGVARWQKATGVLVALTLAGLLLTGNASVAIGLIASVVCAGLLFKILLAVTSIKPPPARTGMSALSDAELPNYTVLIPAYGEEAVIGDTIRWMADLDYPRDKLEVLVLLERRDEVTIRAVRAVNPPDFIRIVLLPPGLPQTKPRSINLGLMLARGELLVIFDAEDRPERDQLRKAAQQFAVGGEQLACVQAKLNFYNRGVNRLTRLFAVEFAFWFDLMLVGLARLRLPVPLGGTSNHIRTGILRQVGGWDAWNVTEDADLGLRFASFGYRVEVVDSTTWEECPAHPWAWIRQRTRWLKGYLLTLLVHTRRPVAAARRFGLPGLVSLVGIVAGTPVAAMLWPFAFVFGAVSLATPLGSGWKVLHVASSAMWVTAALMAVCILIAARRRQMGGLIAVLVPFYWLFHAVAGWRGLVQLLRAPFAWEKTNHGTR